VDAPQLRARGDPEALAVERHAGVGRHLERAHPQRGRGIERDQLSNVTVGEPDVGVVERHAADGLHAADVEL
jgi:hypothetical protein